MTFRSSTMDELFSEKSKVKKYLDIEITLANVQAEVGLIPQSAAEAIANNAQFSKIDMQRYRNDFDQIGFPIVGLIRQLSEIIPKGYGEYMHWGATTQDIMDTGLVLILKEVIERFEVELDGLIDLLVQLANGHKSTLMIGRSQMQQAIPITFGFKVAGWLSSIIRHQERLKQLKPRLLQLQFGGAVGTLASLGEIGFIVRDKLGVALDLSAPKLSWHTQRDNLTEFLAFIGILTGSTSKIANDILLMTQSEIGELTEKSNGKSSTMPNKRNPTITQKVLVAGKHARSGMQAAFEAMIQDHERGSATWQMEWKLIPDTISHGFYALKTLNKLLQNSIQVNKSAMLKNLDLSTAIYAESLMMALAPTIGRQRAHDLVDNAVNKIDINNSFEDNVRIDKEIIAVLSIEEVKRIFTGKVHAELARKSVDILLDGFYR